MTDLTNALLLPEVLGPSPGLLKTLAIYWDELVLVDYTERLMGNDPPAAPPQAQRELEAEGLLRRIDRSLLPDKPPVWLVKGTEQVLNQLPLSAEERRRAVTAASRGELVERLLALSLMPSHEARRVIPRPQKRWDDLSDEERQPLLATTRHFLESIFRLAEEHYVARVTDACDLAALNDWGPVAGSSLSAMAAALGPRQDDLPLAEAALISVTAEAFAIDPDTPVSDIVAVREKHRSSMGRLRGSLIDLSASISTDGTPSQVVNRARSTFTNRVAPSLGELETILSESKIKFFLRSLIGGVTYAIPPHDPIRGMVGGLRVTSEIIDYRFSHETLLSRHPYGYLHHVGNELGAGPAATASTFLETQRNPMKVFAQLFHEQKTRSAAIREILGFGVGDVEA